MGSSCAVPVLRTTDLTEALAAARALLALADLSRATVNVSGQAADERQLRRLLAALPGAASIRSADTSGPIEWYEAVADIPSAAYPVEARVEELQLGAFDEAAVLAALDTGLPGSLEWWDTPWPEVPELGLPREGKYADVQISVHCRGVFLDEPSADHTVHVHLFGGRIERADWLAGKVGLAVVGPAQAGW
ncbi:hypothetical protein [Kitasatospora sp. McL0602]|uniref:hypothetical protein n=1 Tax=Kitasatospora sp. McL0602 TaxID=3439530 RepID=UPI003F892B67